AFQESASVATQGPDRHGNGGEAHGRASSGLRGASGSELLSCGSRLTAASKRGGMGSVQGAIAFTLAACTRVRGTRKRRPKAALLSEKSSSTLTGLRLAHAGWIGVIPSAQ